MLIKDILPNQDLSEFIRCFRIVHMVPMQDITDFSKYYVPKPEMVLHAIVKGKQRIKLTSREKDEFSYDIFLSGQQTSPFIFVNTGELLNIQIVFKPIAFFKLTGIPSFEITNNFFDAHLIFGHSVGDYLQALQGASSYLQMIAVAESYVRTLLKKTNLNTLRIDRLFDKNWHLTGNQSIDWMAKEACLSNKQFKRVFFERVGVNPKIYSRITRFYKAYNIKNARPDWEWLRIAVVCNYYDYQHLCKDYLFFTGTTPVQYHQQIESISPERLLGIAQPVYTDRFRQLHLE